VEAVLESSSSREEVVREVENPPLARARDLLGSGQAEAAVGALDEAVKVDPFSAEAHFLLGKALRVRGDAFRAMTALERAVELRPGLFPALQSLTATYLEKGFRAKAAETLERAVRAAPDEPTRSALRAELLKLL
jgi:Tfp pilus assembly protein PilF